MRTLAMTLAAGLIVPIAAPLGPVAVGAGDVLGPFVPPVGFLHGVDHTGHVPNETLPEALRPRHRRLAKLQTYAVVAGLEETLITYTVSDPCGETSRPV